MTLLNNPRQILNEKGENTTIGGILPAFEYTDRAARLLTSQEVNSACGIKVGDYNKDELVNTCTYLMENYAGYFLETPYSASYYSVWYVDDYWRRVYLDCDGEPITCGVRPAIDVPKERIEF